MGEHQERVFTGSGLRAGVMFKAGLTRWGAVGTGQLSTFSAMDGWTLSLLGLLARIKCGLVVEPAE